jgi:formylglycine-generating enzyme required for sulfatase activity
MVSLFFQRAHAEALKPNSKMILIPAGTYVPFFEKRTTVAIQSFWIDKYPVTKKDFQQFLKKNPMWLKNEIKKIFADPSYLKNWHGDRFSNQEKKDSPVVNVSWFAAKAYCEFYGKSLPTTDQWEYVADDRGKGSKEAQKRILDWYSKPSPKYLSSVGQAANSYQVDDLYGLVWEWTLDFNSSVFSDGDKNLFCGGGAQGASDPSDYVRFMRYSFRSSLKANYTIGNLGFRCVQEVSQ